MASGTPVPLAILQALEAQLGTISTGSGDDTDVQYTRIGDALMTEIPKPAILLRPAFTDFGQTAVDGPLDALSGSFALLVDIVIDTLDDPEVDVMKFERDVIQAVLDFTDTHPGGALDIRPLSTDPWVTGSEQQPIHGSTITFSAAYRALRTDINQAV